MSLNKAATKRAQSEAEKEKSELPSAIGLIDNLSNHAHSLRALGALLESSNLMPFADEGLTLLHPTNNEYSSNLRAGLCGLIDLWLEKQDRIVSEYTESYEKNDYIILKGFEGFIKACKEGMFQRDAAAGLLESRIEDIEPIISGNDELRDQAEKAKRDALDFIVALRGKGGVQCGK